VLTGVRAGGAWLVVRTASAADARLHTVSAEDMSFSFGPHFERSSDTAAAVARDRFIAVSDRYRISKSPVPA